MKGTIKGPLNAKYTQKERRHWNSNETEASNKREEYTRDLKLTVAHALFISDHDWYPARGIFKLPATAVERVESWSDKSAHFIFHLNSSLARIKFLEAEIYRVCCA